MLTRIGSLEEWEKIRWIIVDQGGTHGTYVNNKKIDPFVSFPLNADDLVGLGTADNFSIRNGGKETFVYKIRAPRAYQQMVKYYILPSFLLSIEGTSTKRIEYFG